MRSIGRSRMGSLRTKLIVSCVGLVLISVVPVIGLNFRATRGALIDGVNQTILAAASQTAARLDDFVNNQLDTLRTDAQLPAIIGYLALLHPAGPNDPAASEVKAVLQALSRRDRLNIISYALLDRFGINVLDTADERADSDESGRDYFTIPLQTGLPYAAPIIFSNTGQAILVFSSPVRDSNGATIGVLRVAYNAALIQQLIIQNNDQAGEQSFGMVLDENGLYIAHGIAPELLFTLVAPLDQERFDQMKRDLRLPAQLIQSQTLARPAFAQGIARASEQPFFSSESHKPDADFDQNSVVKLATRSWSVVFARPQSLVVEVVNAQVRNTLLLSLLILVLVAGLATLVARSLAAPIIRLTAVAERVRGGDQTAQALVETKDEIGVLAETFNRMTSDLQQTLGTLEGRVAERTAALSAALQAQEAQSKQLADALAVQQQLNDVIAALSAPVIPVRDGVLVVPFVGLLDGDKMDQAAQRILGQVQATQAQVVVIDITGVPVVDAQVVGALVQLAQSVRLLGAQLVMVGIRPEVAQVLVSLDADMYGIQTWATLQQALEYAKIAT